MSDRKKCKPIRIAWIPREGPASAHTFTFIGNLAPRTVREAAAKYTRDKTATSEQILTNYYGIRDKSALRELLGINFAKIVDRFARSTERAESGDVRKGGAHSRTTVLDASDEELRAIERELAAAEHDSERTEQSFGADTSFVPKFEFGGTTIVQDIAIFPDDSFADIKRKIYVATRIPPYRQHLAAIRARDIAPNISYSIVTIGDHVIDWRNLFEANPTMNIFGVPIDRSIYDAREDLHVDARDHTTTIERIHPTYFVVLDLAQWFAPHLEEIRANSRDIYRADMYYYGFIVKFFPQLTRECFQVMLTNEREMIDRFPDLAPSWSNVSKSVAIQCKIVRMTLEYNNRDAPKLSHVITRATVTSQPSGMPARTISLRDIFDNIVCSERIVDVRAIVDASASIVGLQQVRYNLRKFYRYSELVSADDKRINSYKVPPMGSEPGIIITYNSRESEGPPMFMMIRANGRVSFQYYWHESDAITFDSMAAIFERDSREILAELRRTSSILSIIDVTPIDAPDHLRILSLNIGIVWNKTISSRTFTSMRELWYEYINANLALPHTSVRDIFSFVFTRGVAVIDVAQLDQRLAAAGIAESNHYAYLSVASMRQKWNQTFAGRVVTVRHRATDVYFEMIDAYETEYHVFAQYIGAFLVHNEFGAKDRANIVVATNAPNQRRLRRLQEIDPVLYDLKKYGAPRVYSTRCQSGKQPILYSDQEVAAHRVPRGAVRYWNFTTQKPAFYHCPDARYPHLNFIVGVHPLGYCIPCCGKTTPAPGSHHAHIATICQEQHQYDVNADTSHAPIGYVMSYGKNIPEGRLSYLPPGALRDALNGAARSIHDGAELLIYGVSQGLSVINTLRAIIGATSRANSRGAQFDHHENVISTAEFTHTIAREIDRGTIPFDTIAGGRASMFFSSRRAFSGYLANISDNVVFPEGTIDFMRDILTDCVRIVYKINVIYWMERDPSKLIFSRNAIDDMDDEEQYRVGFAIVTADDEVHPILTIHPDDYVRNRAIIARTLVPTCAHILANVMRNYIRDEMTHAAIRVPDLELIVAFVGASSGAQIIAQIIGTRGLCYGVIVNDDERSEVRETRSVSDEHHFVYVPIDFSRTDGEVSPIYDSFARVKEKPSLRADTNHRFLEKVNAYIGAKRLPYHVYQRDAAVSCEGNVHSDSREIIGIIYEAGQRMIAYCDACITGDDSLRGMTDNIVVLPIDPRDISRLDRSASPARDATKAIFPYYEYELFCVQFMAIISIKLRNNELRKRIKKLMRATSDSATLRGNLAKLGLSKRDISLVLLCAESVDSANRSSNRSRKLDDYVLDIDFADLHQHIARDTAHILADWIVSIMADSIIQVESNPTLTPMITPCDDESSAPYCKDKKLMLVTKLSVLAEILASDLRNPMRRSYIFARGSLPESRAHFADFTQRASEVTIIRADENRAHI